MTKVVSSSSASVVEPVSGDANATLTNRRPRLLDGDTVVELMRALLALTDDPKVQKEIRTTMGKRERFSSAMESKLDWTKCGGFELVIRANLNIYQSQTVPTVIQTVEVKGSVQKIEHASPF